MLGQSIRARIESVLPLGLSAWASAAKGWRPRLKQRIGDFSARRGFWRRFAAAAWAEPDRAPTDADFEALLAGTPQRPKGSVALVGAGPGDAELLTLKAVRALQSASVILYDDLVGPEVLELARREAKRISVGKKGHGRSCSQAEINRQMVELARAGETVVRLKGGDPLIFGRATEEIDACRAAGIDVSIIPGISAAQGAAAALGFSLTERDEARRVQFVTGHAADGKLPADIDWKAVADPKADDDHLHATQDACAIRPQGDRERARSAHAGRRDRVRYAGRSGAGGRDDRRDRHPAAALPPGAPVIVVIGQVARAHAAAPATLIPFRKAS
jgi:uroporphyrin-III C-methyltransferase/precorrin-2 dehydrogenase/sirohydrochlorin ferrochelatase